MLLEQIKLLWFVDCSCLRVLQCCSGVLAAGACVLLHLPAAKDSRSSNLPCLFCAARM
jgi:hypothetical protein